LKPPRQVTKNEKERWLVDLREFGGSRLYCKTEKEARRLYSESLEERAEFGNRAFDLPHADRVRYLAIETKLARAGATLDQVVDFWLKTHRPAHRKPIGEAVEECLRVKSAAGRRERSMRQLGYALGALVRSVGPETIVADVTHEQIETWLANPDWSMRTRAGRLIDARTFFAFAIRRGWAVSDPGAKVEPITVDQRPPGILTVPQVRRLMDACWKVAPRFLPFITLGLFCGVRPEEIKQLTWEQVNLATGYVEIPAAIAKRIRGGGSRQRRLIRIQPAAAAWLKLGGDLPPVSWQDQFDRVRHAAGFQANARGRLGRRRRTKWEPWPRNGMRHSFCSYCLPIFGERDEAQWAGHSPEMAVAHYRELVTVEAAREFWGVRPR